MPRFAANLSMLYPELAFLDRFAAAARRRLSRRRVPLPLRLRAPTTRRAPARQRPAAGALQRAARRLGSAASAASPACRAARPSSATASRSALDYAAALDCPRVHVMAGLVPAGAEREAVQPALRRQPALGRGRGGARPGVDVLIEPINTRDIPRLLPEPAGPGARDRRRGRRAESQGADGPLPLPDRRGRRGDEDPQVPAHRPRRPLADRRRARAPRARRRRAELSLPVRRDRRGVGACGWDGWVGCEYRPGRGAAANGTSAGLGWLRALPSA